MGSGASTQNVKDYDKYVCKLDEPTSQDLLSRTRGWRVFSEDLEWAMMKLKPSMEKYTIGRRTENLVQLVHKTTSGLHAEMTFDKAASRWEVKDIGSSTGTAALTEDAVEVVAKDDKVALGPNSAVRFGKCMMVLVSDQVTTHMLLECTEGPVKGQYWRVPTGAGLMSCGTVSGSTINVSGTEGLSPTEFQIYRYNGWTAISDVAARSSKTANADKESQDKTKDAKNLNGTYLNGGLIKRREMFYLWLGAVISLGVQGHGEGEAGATTVAFPVKFVVKCKVKLSKR